MLTLSAIGVYLGLLALNFVLASISHHIKAIVPIWLLSDLLNKIAAVAVPICIVIDIVRLIF